MDIPIETLQKGVHPLPPKWAASGKGKDSMDGYQELANAIGTQVGMDSRDEKTVPFRLRLAKVTN